MRAVIQDGPGKAYTGVPLPCASSAAAALGGAGSCSLEAFSALIAPAAALGRDTQAWCSACGARDPLPCAAAAAGAAAAAKPVSSAATRDGGGGRTLAGGTAAKAVLWGSTLLGLAMGSHQLLPTHRG